MNGKSSKISSLRNRGRHTRNESESFVGSHKPGEHGNEPKVKVSGQIERGRGPRVRAHVLLQPAEVALLVAVAVGGRAWEEDAVRCVAMQRSGPKGHLGSALDRRARVGPRGEQETVVSSGVNNN